MKAELILHSAADPNLVELHQVESPEIMKPGCASLDYDEIIQ